MPIGLLALGSTLALALRERRRRRLAERLGAAALETILEAIDANDPATGAHVRRVATYALMLAEAADVTDAEGHSVERVALFHDIGKIHGALFDILHDADRLTPEERRAIRTHPVRGSEVLAPLSPFYPDLGAGVLAHHERWDGKGYPRGLKGRRIPLTARIVSIADAFDAMTQRRPYRRGRSFTEALDAISAGRGSQFDPELVDLFLSPPVRDEIEKEMRRAHGPQARGGRRHRRTATAPDLTFRWRTGTTSRPIRRQRRRTAS